jgi:hypothetical protein
VTAPVTMYMLTLSLFALVLAPYSYFLVVLSLICIVKYGSACVMLLSVIILNWKLPNSKTLYV